MRKILTLSLCLFFSAPLLGHAAEIEPQGTMMRKLQRGALNIALCPLEIFDALIRQRTHETMLPGWVYGLGYGSVSAVERVAVGAYEVITFPLAVPAGYKPILDPEFEWQRFV